MPKKNRSFTLVEVTVVIILITILAAFALPNYSKALAKANERTAITNLVAIRGGIKVYLANTGSSLIPDWSGLNTINSALGLTLVDTVNTGYDCVAVFAEGDNKCRVILLNASRLHFHFDGAHNADGSIHCDPTYGVCPSCPASPVGNCG